MGKHLSKRSMARLCLAMGIALVALATVGASECAAGKLMRFAKWASREAVKAALVEYAKHEADQTFDSFKVKFCSDRSFRRAVLSSPTIEPLIRDQDAAEALVMETIGCGYSLGMINVVFTAVIPTEAGECRFLASVRNYSKHHLNRLNFEIDDWRFSVGDMVANTYEDDMLIFELEIKKGNSCWYQASWLNEHIKDAAPLDCSIPNLAEGDCQSLLTVASAIDIDKVKSSESDLVRAARARQVAALAQEEEEKNNLRKTNLHVSDAFLYSGSDWRRLHSMGVGTLNGLTEDQIRSPPDFMPIIVKPGCAMAITEIRQDKDKIDIAYRVVRNCENGAIWIDAKSFHEEIRAWRPLPRQ